MTEISMVISALVFIMYSVYLWNVHKYLRQTNDNIESMYTLMRDQATENIKAVSNLTNNNDGSVTREMVDKAFKKNRDIDR